MDKKRKKVWGSAAGLLDPILRKWAQKVAAGVSPDSILRSDVVNAVLGALKGLVEVIGESLPPSASVLIEKITDFSDFFTGALGSEVKKTSETAITGWMNKFFADAGPRLEKATDRRQEFENIKLEFELRRELLKLIEEASKPPEPEPTKVQPTEPSWNWEKWQKKFSDFAEKWYPQIKSSLKIADHETAQKIYRFNRWLATKGVR